MSNIDAIRAALLAPDSPEPEGAHTYREGEVRPGIRVRVRPFLHLPAPESGAALTPVRFARTWPATVTGAYSGAGLIPVRFEDEHVAQIANGAGFKPEELHRPNCPCAACGKPR